MEIIYISTCFTEKIKSTACSWGNVVGKVDSSISIQVFPGHQAFGGMPSTCDLPWLSEHATTIHGNSAPTQALNEADDAGLTPAHSRPVHSGEGRYGIHGCLQSKQMLTSKIHQGPCPVCQLALLCWA